MRAYRFEPRLPAGRNSALRVALRADASNLLGGGHVKRCMSLGVALRDCGLQPVFVSRALDATAAALFADSGFEVRWLVEDAQQDAQETCRVLQTDAPACLVVDHYGLDADWHDALRAGLGCLVVAIDDLANRPLACDLLCDPNDPLASDSYRAVLRRSCKVLGGPAFALLDPLYAAAPRYVFQESVKSIGIFMGTTDPSGIARAALDACRVGAGFTGAIEVVCAAHAPHFPSLQSACARWPATRLVGLQANLAAFFARHDLQLGAGGGASWERCCIGPPSIVCEAADNQRAVLPHLQRAGAALCIPQGPAFQSQLVEAVCALIGDPQRRLGLHQQAIEQVDGKGGQRVAAAVACAVGLALHLRPAVLADEKLLLLWANDPEVRRQAFHSATIETAEHAAWFAQRLSQPAKGQLWIAQAPNGEPVGQVRLDRIDAAWELSYSVGAAYRGLGVGTRMVQQVLDRLRVAKTPVIARVKATNGASLAVFRRLGFTESTVADARGAHQLFLLTLS